jgi:hypothetical protein
LLACAGAAASAQDLAPLASGIRAYRAGDYAVALASFEDARAQGDASDTLLFNLGLTHYRLGHYGLARRSFLDLRARPDMAAIAEYHLGLVAAALGQMDRATTHLRAAAAGNSAELRRLALTALERLTDRPQARQPAAVAYAGVGHDTNRNQVSELLRITGPQSESAYLELSGVVQYPLADLNDTDLRAGFFRRDYEEDDDLDQTVMQFSLRRAWRPGRWRLTLAGESDIAFLSGDSLLNAYGLSFEGVRRAGASTLRLRLRPATVHAASDFDYLDGQRHRADVSNEFPIGEFLLRLGYDAEINDRRDLVSGQQFLSQSPVRHGPFLRISRTFTPDFSIETNATYRHSRYRGINRYLQNGTLRSERRVEDLVALGASARWVIAPAWILRLDYRYIDNRSTLDTYDYTRDMAMLALEWRY